MLALRTNKREHLVRISYRNYDEKQKYYPFSLETRSFYIMANTY